MKRLLVVADNSLIAEAIRGGLRDSGAFQLVGYSDARHAGARMIADAGVNVVLVDEGDRSPDALQLIRNIKEEAEDVTVIILTVQMEGPWLAGAFEAGADGAISKAVHPVALATLVREALAGHIVHSLSNMKAERETRQALVAERAALTERELQILQLVASGATNGDIARRLWITQQTVKFHVSNIYRKLDVTNRTEACHYAHVNGLVAPGEPVRLGLIGSNGTAPKRPQPRMHRNKKLRVSEGRLDVRARVGGGDA
jgi:DNA-binding NarL/FixJ family response regulator